MSALSELEMRILSELQEAGEEDVVTLIVTVMDPVGDRSEVEETCAALENLVRAGFVGMGVEFDSNKRLKALPEQQSLAVIAELPANLRYEGERRSWADIRHIGPPYGMPFPYVVGTKSGLARALEILQERGYQWWRRET